MLYFRAILQETVFFEVFKDCARSINDMMARTYTVGEDRKLLPSLLLGWQNLRQDGLPSSNHSRLMKSSEGALLFHWNQHLCPSWTGTLQNSWSSSVQKDPSASAVMKRDVTLRCLIEYTGESGQELISDYCGTAETTVHGDLEMKNMSIYICREPNAVGIIIEGVPVLTHLGNLAKACCLLLGLTYELNLEYPSKLSKTFEVFQRLFVGLDTLRPKPTPKFMTLKNKLLA
ncbi:uncharacterized protein LOC133651599 [Entelurus aequoreus]|uniref:uncharacterized protein LOC133651599 n=1 Tax=Entelurus aequoreus TaxID=161455 RepID=UPI002B1D8CB5|nr:uncharacterized protein LOC133651599 [Entelurus aequoreus]